MSFRLLGTTVRCNGFVTSTVVTKVLQITTDNSYTFVASSSRVLFQTSAEPFVISLCPMVRAVLSDIVYTRKRCFSVTKAVVQAWFASPKRQPKSVPRVLYPAPKTVCPQVVVSCFELPV